jgi:hypothetical protein
MTATNPITGDEIKTKTVTKAFTDNYAGIDWSVKLNTDEPLCNGCGEIQCKCSNK